VKNWEKNNVENKMAQGLTKIVIWPVQVAKERKQDTKEGTVRWIECHPWSR